VLYLTNNLFVRLTMYEPVFENFYSRLYENSRLPALMIFSIVFTSHFTHFGMLLLCLNRLSAILYYMSYERVRNMSLSNMYNIDVDKTFRFRCFFHVWRIVFYEFSGNFVEKRRINQFLDSFESLQRYGYDI
jgi:hypothetical protein